MLRALPGVSVVAPCDAFESYHALKAIAANPGVAYFRIEKQTPLDTSDLSVPFELGKARRLREGRDVSLICIGGITLQAMEAARMLAKRGIEARVVSMHTLKPLDAEEIVSAMNETGGIVTLEENTVLGGLGSAVAEVIAETGKPVAFRRMGIQDIYSSIVGAQDYLLKHNNLDARAVCVTASELIGRG